MMDLSDKKILVTGGTGFLGRSVYGRLINACWNVTAVGGRTCDLTDHYSADYLFETLKPDVVIHLAAYCGGIGANQADPSEMFYRNMTMGMNVLDKCCKYEAEKVVLVGTVCSYPKHCPVPFREDDLWNGYPEETNAPYGIAKRALFEMARACHVQRGLKVACLLPANLYGPGDNFDLQTSHAIPAMIRKMIEAKEAGERFVHLWGTGKATREFLYVADAARAIVRAAEMVDTPEPINVGTGSEISIYELAHLIRSIVGYEGEIVWDGSKPDGQPRRCLDLTRAKERLGWQADVRLETGLRKTAAWYTTNRKVAVVA